MRHRKAFDGPDARHLDSITVADFVAGFNDPGASALINSITRSLLGVESAQPSALFFLDILKSGTDLKKVLSDFQEGAQYIRNRQGKLCQRFGWDLPDDMDRQPIIL